TRTTYGYCRNTCRPPRQGVYLAFYYDNTIELFRLIQSVYNRLNRSGITLVKELLIRSTSVFNVGETPFCRVPRNCRKSSMSLSVSYRKLSLYFRRYTTFTYVRTYRLYYVLSTDFLQFRCA